MCSQVLIFKTLTRTAL